tara:strand:+ start:25 stop:510 length:486 start_codon:yes stop_codon:yes gene_type:complete
MAHNPWNIAPGLRDVGSYQVSGRPFASGSCLAPASGSASLVIRFPTVTKWFQIEPHQTELRQQLRVAFSENGLHGKGGANFRVHASSSLCGPLDMKISELWFMGDLNSEGTFTFDLVAGLTGIPYNRTSTETSASINGAWAPDGSTIEAGGPNWSGSIGVG